MSSDQLKDYPLFYEEIGPKANRQPELEADMPSHYDPQYFEQSGGISEAQVAQISDDLAHPLDGPSSSVQ